MSFFQRDPVNAPDMPAMTSELLADLKQYVDALYVDLYPRAESGDASGVFPGRKNAAHREADFLGAVQSSAVQDKHTEEAVCAGMPLPKSKAPAARLPGLDGILRSSEATFSEYLLDLLRERDGRDSEVYKRAEVSKQLFSKILGNRDYQPTKSTAIQLAIGLQLDLHQTQKLLEKAGFALTRSSKTDLVVQYCIERKIYSVSFINEALYDCGLPLLKTGLKV